MLEQISLLQVGSIVVPLVSILCLTVFALYYFREWKEYLMVKRTYVNIHYLEDAFKGYVQACGAYQHCCTKKVWRWFFESRYADLVDHHKAQVFFFIDRIDTFGKRKGFNRHTFADRSFLVQWGKLRDAFFRNNILTGKYEYEPCSAWYSAIDQQNAINLFHSIFISKMYELYRKEALLLLRTDGYTAFSVLMSEQAKEAGKYALATKYLTPYSNLDGMDRDLVWSNASEIREKLEGLLKKILNTRSLDEKYKALRQLHETPVCKNYSYEAGCLDILQKIKDEIVKAKALVN